MSVVNMGAKLEIMFSKVFRRLDGYTIIGKLLTFYGQFLICDVTTKD